MAGRGSAPIVVATAGHHDLASQIPLLDEKHHGGVGAAYSHSSGVSAPRGCISRKYAVSAFVVTAAIAVVVLVYTVIAPQWAQPMTWLHPGSEPIDLDALLDDDARETGSITRLDTQGHYTHFHTVSLIMAPQTQPTHDVYESIHALIVSEYSHIAAALPVSSYHVTLSTIFDRRRSSSLEQHNALLRHEQPRLERAKWAFHAVDDAPLTFRVVAIQTWMAGVALLLQPKTIDDLRRLTLLSELANNTLGTLYRHEKWWHSTLAYYIPQRVVQQSEVDEMRSKLLKIARSVDIVVQRPHICNTKSLEACEYV